MPVGLSSLVFEEKTPCLSAVPVNYGDPPTEDVIFGGPVIQQRRHPHRYNISPLARETQQGGNSDSVVTSIIQKTALP